MNRIKELAFIAMMGLAYVGIVSVTILALTAWFDGIFWVMHALSL